MLTTHDGYSLADIAAATGRDRDGIFGDSSLWLIVLFLFTFSNNGWGRCQGPYLGSSVREEVAYGFDMNGLENGIRGIQNGLCDGFYSMNTGMLNGFCSTQNTMAQGFAGLNTVITNSERDLASKIDASTYTSLQNTNAIQSKLADIAYNQSSCCCATQRAIDSGFAELNYNLASQECQTRQTVMDSARDIIESQNAGVRSILDFLTKDKIATLQSENQSLRFAASQQAQSAYLTELIRSNYGAGCGCY